MLEELKEFRDKMDNLMSSCMDKTIVIYGYGYQGRFVAWLCTAGTEEIRTCFETHGYVKNKTYYV